MNITLRQLRAVAALGRHGSVTRAAGELHVSPPAVTLQIKAIEDQLGIVLVERSASGMELTEAGTMIADASARIEAVLREAEAGIAALNGAERGEIHVGIISTAKYYAPRAVAAFAEAAFGFCLGCKVFGLLIRAGVVPAGVCEDCGDLGRRHPELARQVA